MTHPIQTASAYHRSTGYARHRMSPHTLDWANQPQLAKSYPHLKRVPLIQSDTLPAVDYFHLVQRACRNDRQSAATLDLNTVSMLFRLTQAVTARSMHSGQPFYYRSVASAGALYPFELYLAVHRVDGLAPGVYHYDVFDFSLTALRGDAVPPIPPFGHGVAATVYISGIFFRSAWKYRSRAYRYVLLDAGHLLENLRLASTALSVSFSVHLDFDDHRAGTLLGLDPQREACLAVIHLADSIEEKTPEVSGLTLAPLGDEIVNASRVSTKEVTYPEILQAHGAGSGWEEGVRDSMTAIAAVRRSPQTWQPVTVPDKPGGRDYVDVLWHRRSRRNFISEPLSDERLRIFLGLLADAAAADLPCSRPSVIDIGFLAGVGGALAPGFYLYDPHGRRWGRLSQGDLVEPMAKACLDQMWLKNAALHLMFMTDTAALDRFRGPRGYRHAMIEAGRLGQQAYLAATALGMGACGIGAIYDREAADLLDLGDDGALLYLVGIGPIKAGGYR
jgi:SagB-type dehydrogenase family enzyme